MAALEYPYPAVLCGIFLKNLQRTVGRAVVDAQDLYLPQSLAQDGIKAFAKIVLYIVNRNYH